MEGQKGEWKVEGELRPFPSFFKFVHPGVSPFVKPGDIRFTFWKAVIVIMDQVVIGHSLCDWNSENRWMMRISALFGPPGLSASGKSLDSSVQETNATGNDRGAILIIKRNPFNSLPLYVQNHPSICFSIGMSVPGRFLATHLQTWADSQKSGKP